MGDEFRRNPYPFYARLRTQGPVHRIRMSGGIEAWLVVGYHEGKAVLADARLSKDWDNASESLGLTSTASGRHMLYSDPPYHTRLRKLVNQAFTTRRVQHLAPRIQQITDHLIDAVLAKPDHVSDVIEALAFPLAISVICELLGVPDLEQDSFKEWSHKAGSTNAESRRAAAAEGSRYLQTLVRNKRQIPSDDLLSALIKLADDDGDQLSDDELSGMAWLLLVAGHETTVNLIANGVFALLSHPDQMAALRADPDLLDNAVEEILRFDGPIETPTYRFTVDPFEVGGTVIPGGGELVLVAVGDANHDPARFPDPDTFDIRRDTRGHVAFGHGIHYCLGAPLARLEARIVIRHPPGTLPRHAAGY